MTTRRENENDPYHYLGRRVSLLWTCGDHRKGVVAEVVEAWSDRPDRLFLRLQNSYDRDHSVVPAHAVRLLP